MQARDKKQKATCRQGQGQSQTKPTPHTHSWGSKYGIECVWRVHRSCVSEKWSPCCACCKCMRKHTHIHTQAHTLHSQAHTHTQTNTVFFTLLNWVVVHIFALLLDSLYKCVASPRPGESKSLSPVKPSYHYRHRTSPFQHCQSHFCRGLSISVPCFKKGVAHIWLAYMLAGIA